MTMETASDPAARLVQDHLDDVLPFADAALPSSVQELFAWPVSD